MRDVRSEIQNLSFTPKETDIYKIHQSGDLANLDGLDDSSLKVLPSLLTLRDALYSPDFRDYLSSVTGSGPLSGRKTDMAINVYTPGCHLLCHDDVIGSRRVSYILYLTDPDKPWQKEWGGALRLYPNTTYTENEGESVKAPSPEHTVSIPPAFNQLSFFAVQPGESFHDVEEVYGQASINEGEGDEARIRMAISGWYHIPQEGEDGFIEGLEDRLAEKSSLQQLQGASDKLDLPRPSVQLYAMDSQEDDLRDEKGFSEEELSFLLNYIAPTYLTPDTVESIRDVFVDECSLCLENFLLPKFAGSLRAYIQECEREEVAPRSDEKHNKPGWTVARPPHKHRFLFQQTAAAMQELSPLQEILQGLIPSKAFQKWLSLVTDHQVASHNALGRRFRRGKDYTLATGYEEESPRVEICLGITPTTGRGDDQATAPESQSNGDAAMETKDTNAKNGTTAHAPEDGEGVGGYLAYMAGDDDKDGDGEENEAGSNHSIAVPPDMSTGGHSTKATNPKKAKQDPAIYQASGDDEDDGILFTMSAGWNRLGIVLRDKGTMRFVKYVSRMAKEDRWDIVGEFEIVDEEAEDGENSVSGIIESNATTSLEHSVDDEEKSHDDEGDDEDDALDD